jgi:hypothetical protein
VPATPSIPPATTAPVQSMLPALLT